MSPLQVASVALILFAAFDWIATIVLVRAAQRMDEPALTERAIASFILTAIATGFAVLALGYLIGTRLPQPVTAILLVGGLLAVSVPQLVWLLAYWGGRFR